MFSLFMKKVRKAVQSNIGIIIILIFAAFLRLWSLQNVPPSPSLDEVSIGYNAYSIMRTGRDEYGSFLPILLRAYDDWRPGLYVYLVIPSVALFGLNAFAVLFPSVLLSIMTIYLTYLLVQLIFHGKVEVRGLVIDEKFIALASSFSLAISPWDIYLSRLGHEVNLGLFITVFSVYLFLKGVLKKNKTAFCLSAISFGLGFSTYQSEKVILPVVMLALFLLFWKELVSIGKTMLVSLVLFLILAVPAIVVTFSPQGLTRFQGTSVFSSNHSVSEKAPIDLLDAKNGGDLLRQVYYNRRFVPVRVFIAQYFSHFNPTWLFFGSERENHKVPYLGLLYAFEAPFLIFGMIVFLLSKVDRKIKILLFVCFFSSPLPASITTEAPHAMRSFTFLPTIQIFEAIGLVYLYSLLSQSRVKILSLSMYTLFVVMGIWQFIRGYFIIFPKTQADSFQSALLDSMYFVGDRKNSFQTIVVSNKDNLYQSYMFYLFATKYDPSTYQKKGGTGSGGYAIRHTIENIQFRPIIWREEKKKGKILYVGNESEFDAGKLILREFDYPDRKVGVVAGSYE